MANYLSLEILALEAVMQSNAILFAAAALAIAAGTAIMGSPANQAASVDPAASGESPALAVESVLTPTVHRVRDETGTAGRTTIVAQAQVTPPTPGTPTTAAGPAPVAAPIQAVSPGRSPQPGPSQLSTEPLAPQGTAKESKIHDAIAMKGLTPVEPSPIAKSSAPSVIFFHPDGTGLNHWNALRTLTKGPDGALEWDRLPHMAIYSGHMADALAGTSNGGATVHAYGVQVVARSFGLNGEAPIVAASGKPFSIMQEALGSGRGTGLVQTGHIAEPGTAAFIASVKSRSDHAEIARQVVQSGIPVILGGGEAMLLPKGIAGRHGDGIRTDGLDLVAWAKANGFTVVYTREELAGLDLSKVDKLLGLFARWNTFSDQSEEKNAREGLGHYVSSAPTVAQMSAAALAILSRGKDGFLLVVEEEGTDNMANENNAPGEFEALRRADEAVGVLHRYVEANPSTLLLMAADSDAGGMQLIGPGPGREMEPDKPLPATSKNGAPLDGVGGTGTLPFMSAPDRNFRRWPFAIAWATENDVAGAILVRAAGRNADQVRGRIDNTGIYRIMYETLFSRSIAPIASPHASTTGESKP